MANDLASEVAKARSEERIVTTTWTQFRSKEGISIPAGERPMLAVIPAFVRNITPLQYSRRSFGTQLFESPEHEAMADNIRLQMSSNPADVLTGSDPLPLTNGMGVSYQQIIALAGDFYGVPDNPISDGNGFSDQQTRFLNAFNTLDTGTTQQITNILGVMQQQSNEVNTDVANSPGSDAYSRAYTTANANHKYDKLYNQASGGSGGSTWLFDKGSYLQLAATNWDHFGNHAIAAYKAGHSVAMQQAQAAGRAAASSQRSMLERAYAMEAFCSHFLADLFSAGHLRTPRKALHSSVDPFPDLLSQMMHDEDSYNGLMGSNALTPSTTQWPMYGDKRMLDGENATNLVNAQGALQASANEIYHAFVNVNSTIDPTAFAALRYTPTLSVVLNRSNRQNWPPLFYRGDGDPNDSTNNPSGIQFRIPVTDLDSTSTMSFTTLGTLLYAASLIIQLPSWLLLLDDPYQDLAYLTIWLATPNGGVHSLEGAPPAWLSHMQELAHPFTWAASYALTNTSGAKIPNAQGPAATVAVSSLVNDGHPIDDATHQNDVLHLFFRQSNTSGVLHLQTPMSVVTNQSSAGLWSPGCTVETLNFSTNGQVAAIDVADALTIVYPDPSGKIMQAVITPKQGLVTSGQGAIFGSSAGSHLMATNGAPALVRMGQTLILAYRGNDGVLYFATASPPALSSGSVYYTWNQPTAVSVSGNKVKVTGDPSMIIVDDYLYLAVGGLGSDSPFPILIYRTAITSSPTHTWALYLNGVKNANGNLIKTASFARLFAYADGYAVVAKDSNDNSLFTVMPLRTTAPTQAWNKVTIQVPSTQFTSPPTFVKQKTRSPASSLFYGGNGYLFFSDHDSTNLSLVTSKPPLITPR
jgi:hypothetical protein